MALAVVKSGRGGGGTACCRELASCWASSRARARAARPGPVFVVPPVPPASVTSYNLLQNVEKYLQKNGKTIKRVQNQSKQKHQQ